MQNWFTWAGISFIIGGVISLALTKGATEFVSFREDLSPYSVGWILVGIALIAAGFIKRKK